MKPNLAQLWDKVEESARHTKWKTNRQKLAHYRRTKPKVRPFDWRNPDAALQTKDAWAERQLIRDLRRKCYQVYGSPVVAFDFVNPPGDYLLRLGRRHGRRFSKVPEIIGLRSEVWFGTRNEIGYYNPYKVGIAYVDSFRATLADGRTVLHFNGEFCNTWEQHSLKRRPVNQRPPQPVDLLLAIFTVNRAAKRYRDAAQSCYRQGAFAFATENKYRKEALYRLKDGGIAAAWIAGRIVAEGAHGGLVKYAGEGYCFHSTLMPKGVELAKLGNGDEALLVDAKPKSASEARLCDAKHTLEDLPSANDDFDRLAVPTVRRKNEFDDCDLEQDLRAGDGEDDEEAEDDEREEDRL